MNKEEVVKVVDQRIFKHILCLILLGLAAFVCYDLFSHKPTDIWNYLGHLLLIVGLGIGLFIILD